MAYAWSCITTSSASQQRRPPTSTRGKRSLWDVRTQRISHDIFLRNVSGEKCGTPAKVSSGEAMIPAACLRLVDRPRVKVQFQFEPRDLWIGLFWRRDHAVAYTQSPRLITITGTVVHTTRCLLYGT